MRGVKIAMKRSENEVSISPAVRGLPGCGFLEIPDHGLTMKASSLFSPTGSV